MSENRKKTKRSYQKPAVPTVLSTASGDATQTLLYEGTFRGLVTGESVDIPTNMIGAQKIDTGVTLSSSSNLNIFTPNTWHGGAQAKFVMKLEENIEGVPDEILVQTTQFGHFGKNDKVILEGKVFRINFKHWDKLFYSLIAEHYYNESLQIGDEGFRENEQEVYKGTIRGSVNKESRTHINVYYKSKPHHPHSRPAPSSPHYSFGDIYFTMNLEKIGIAGLRMKF